MFGLKSSYCRLREFLTKWGWNKLLNLQVTGFTFTPSSHTPVSATSLWEKILFLSYDDFIAIMNDE